MTTTAIPTPTPTPTASTAEDYKKWAILFDISSLCLSFSLYTYNILLFLFLHYFRKIYNQYLRLLYFKILFAVNSSFIPPYHIFFRIISSFLLHV